MGTKTENSKSVVERFKNRKSLSSEIKVFYPDKNKPELVITATRPAEEEMRMITLKAMEAQIQKKTDYSIFEETLVVLKRHAINWDMDGEAFSKELFEDFIKSLNAAEMVAMASALRLAMSEDESLGKN